MTEIETFEQSVNDGKAVLRLMENEDFKKIFIKDQENKLLEIGYAMHHLDDSRRDKAIKELESIGYFFDRIMSIIHAGNSATEALNEMAEMGDEDAGN